MRYILEEVVDIGDGEIVGLEREVSGEAGEVIAGAAGLVERRRLGHATALVRPRVAREVPEQTVGPPAQNCLEDCSGCAGKHWMSRHIHHKHSKYNKMMATLKTRHTVRIVPQHEVVFSCLKLAFTSFGRVEVRVDDTNVVNLVS